MSLHSILHHKGYTSEDLDSVVNDTASRAATQTNNNGLSAQLKYLAEQGLSDKDIVEALESMG
ncbi:hypothetical protein AB4254_08005 [Vibrio breoganii]